MDQATSDRPSRAHSASVTENTTHHYDQTNTRGGSSVQDPSTPVSDCSQTRMTKSASWFNSLSRRASRKTPLKKRSLGVERYDTENCPPEERQAARHRLNKSDWDVRKTGMSFSPGVSATAGPTSRSTDCLDLEATTTDLSTLDLTDINESRDELDLVLNVSAGDMASLGHPNMYYTMDSRRLANKHKKSQQDRALLYGIKQFNLEPSRGLTYLEETGFLSQTPESVARFLFRQERLSKKQIGKYLGSHQEYNQAVLTHFVRCHQFSRLLLVQALRQFLWSFRLPGEAMQIDRVMDAFAGQYCEQNPNIFEEKDTCFILSFSIIMLNTALHNPNAKIKISAEQFVKQNKGINSGKDLPSDMLEAIYRNIKEEPFKIPDETYDDLMYTFFSPEREGWLLKQGGSWKSWKRRWFVLNDRCLYYFEHTAENVPKGIIPLENVRVRSIEERDGKQWVFEIYSDLAEIIKGCKTDTNGTVVQGNHKYYRLSTATEEDRDGWVTCIQESIRDNPFQKIISDKKAAIRRRNGQKVPIVPHSIQTG